MFLRCRDRVGRYVEFNLILVRSTVFGRQTGGRTEARLMSLPPLVSWVYDYQLLAGSDEALLTEEFLPIQKWII